jgi:hypothetical protein
MNNTTLVPVPSPSASIIPMDVIKAHNTWFAAEKNIPERDYMKGYTYRNNKARKAWRTFADLCNTHGLGPVSVAHDILASNHSG